MNNQLIPILLVVIFLTGMVIWDTYAWKECRRLHPAWYCVRMLGK